MELDEIVRRVADVNTLPQAEREKMNPKIPATIIFLVVLMVGCSKHSAPPPTAPPVADAATSVDTNPTPAQPPPRKIFGAAGCMFGQQPPERFKKHRTADGDYSASDEPTEVSAVKPDDSPFDDVFLGLLDDGRIYSIMAHVEKASIKMDTICQALTNKYGPASGDIEGQWVIDDGYAVITVHYNRESDFLAFYYEDHELGKLADKEKKARTSKQASEISTNL